MAMCISLMPLISMNLPTEKEFWPTFQTNYIRLQDHTTAYALLSAGVGLFYAFGSYFLVRWFRSPRPSPFLSSLGGCIPNDQVHAMWWFTIGTILTIPVMAIYVSYFPTNHEYAGALFCCSLGSVLAVIITMLFYPTKNGDKDFMAPILHMCCFGPKSNFHVHAKTDMLIVCWLSLFASICATFGCIVVFIYYITKSDALGMFNYSTGAVDMVLFTIGTVYYLAGSYESEKVQQQHTIQQAENGEVRATDLSSPAVDLFPTQNPKIPAEEEPK